VDNQIFITGRVHEAVAARFACESLGEMVLKGKAAPVPIYSVKEPLQR
jgi:class 3 adenylate cyclase